MIAHQVKPRDTSNVTATVLGKLPQNAKTADGIGAAGKYRIRLTNHSKQAVPSVQLRWTSSDDKIIEQVPGTFDVPAEQTRVIQATGPSFEAGKLVLAGDKVAFDNVFYFYQPLPTRKRIVYLSERTPSTDGSELGYFLQKISNDATPDLPQVTIANEEQINAL